MVQEIHSPLQAWEPGLHIHWGDRPPPFDPGPPFNNPGSTPGLVLPLGFLVENLEIQVRKGGCLTTGSPGLPLYNL